MYNIVYFWTAFLMIAALIVLIVRLIQQLWILL